MSTMQRMIYLATLLAAVNLGCNSQPSEKITIPAATESPTATAQATQQASENPLLQNWDTPFGVPPFDRINSQHYLPALRAAMESHQAEITAITAQQATPSFANTIEALERSGAVLTRIGNVFFAVKAAHSDDVLRATGKDIAPEFSAHTNEITMNGALFARVKAVHDQRETLNLNAEQTRLLNETYKRFVRAGVNLPAEDQTKLKAIDAEISTLSQQFAQNVLKETNAFALVVEKQENLGALPLSLVAAAAKEAERRGHAGKWVFTLQRPSINPFLQYSPNRAMRKRLFEGYALRGDNDNENDNKAILAEIAQLRAQRAKLMDFPTHAHFVLSDNMAQNPEAALDLMNKVWTPALATAKREAQDLSKLLHEDGFTGELAGWDWRYYTEKLRKARYDIDEKELRPYFAVNAVRDGVFAVCEKLFGIKFTQAFDLPKWHPTQQVFKVSEADGSYLGIVYLDFFARESKRGGAWAISLRSQSKMDGKVHPIVTTNFNYPLPTDDAPSLLSYREAETLFHEFGHAVHSLLSDINYGSLNRALPRDFIEFPSQVFENWMSEPEVLKMFARHYQTGEIIPDAMIEKLQKSARFNQGFTTSEYLAAAYLDLEWHMLAEAEKQDVRLFEQNAMQRIGMIDVIVTRYRSTYFNHIFSGGYSAGYYGYLWAQVLDADGFEAFKETSLFDKETASRFRKLLSSGGSLPGMELYKNFRGREPSIEPLLARRGFN